MDGVVEIITSRKRPAALECGRQIAAGADRGGGGEGRVEACAQYQVIV
jgi:hypothetical protein